MQRFVLVGMGTTYAVAIVMIFLDVPEPQASGIILAGTAAAAAVQIVHARGNRRALRL